jgi:hypothetical protein
MPSAKTVEHAMINGSEDTGSTKRFVAAVTSQGI